MPIRCPCPHCGTETDVSDEYAGQSGRCFACGRTIRVPPLGGMPGPQTLGGGSQAPTWGGADRRDLAGQPDFLRQRLIWPCFLVCVLLFGVANFVIGPLMSRLGPNDSAVLVYVCFGAIGAEGGLHAIWCVLAPVGLIKRFAVGIGTALVLFGAWALGYGVYVSLEPYLYDDYWEIVVTGLLCLPLVAIAIQLPLWLARAWLGWRVLHRADPSRQSGGAAFGIRDILVATAVLALALSAAKLAVPDRVFSETEFLFPLAIVALVAAGISLFTTLPVVVATLRARQIWLALPVTLALDVMILVVFMATGTAIARRPPPWQAYVGMACMVGGFFVSLTGVMLVARRLGYRLVWGRRQLDSRRRVA